MRATVTEDMGPEQQRAQEYRAFVGSMPMRYETDLMADHVATAYWLARGRGWAADVLIHDCEQALAKGGEVGLVVHRLRVLSDTVPVSRENAPGPWRPPSRSGVCMDAAKISERVELLRMTLAMGTAATPDDAVEMMQTLISEQGQPTGGTS